MTGPQADLELRDFPLAAERPSLFAPLMLGLPTGFLVSQLLRGAGFEGVLPLLGGLLTALVTATLVSAQALRQVPDRLRITREQVALLRGGRLVRGVKLASLSEVHEVETPDGGKVLLIGDDRTIIGLGSFQLERERDYADVTAQIVEAMQRLDPSGERARAAVDAGRLRERLAQQPVRGTVYLGVALLGLSLLALRAADSVLAGRPFALETLGSLVPALISQGEGWRLFSHPFVPNSPFHAVLAALSVFWLGAWLERLLGWERVLLGFVTGVVAAGAVLVTVKWPVPFTGADGGVFGLLGMVLAVRLVSRRRLPRWFRPGALFWVITLFSALQLPVFQRSLGMPASGGVVPAELVVAWAGLAPWLPHLAALLAGLAVGGLLVAGTDLPATAADRQAWRPFAWVACVALAVGVAGGIWHPFRNHPDDAAIIAEGLVSMVQTPYAAEILNGYSYEMVAPESAPPEAVELGAALAETAVGASGRRAWHILDTLAVARFRQNRADDARTLLVEAQKAAERDKLTADQRRLVLDRIDRRLAEIDKGGPLSRE